MYDRYSRQILFKQIGAKGQAEIRKKHVLILGVGALGTHTAEMLVRAGVGKITLIDRDYVEMSNLQRQHLFTEEDAQKKWPKAEAAKIRLQKVNHEVEIEAIVGHADATMLESLIANIDLLMDGTDNFEARFLLNDLAQKYHIPYLFGSCVGSFGMVFTIIPGVTPCLQCLLKRLPLQGQTCDTVGIIEPTVQMVTAHQGAEALKILSGNMETIRKSYVSFDLWDNEYVSLKADALKDSGCPSCGLEATYPYLQAETGLKVAVLCGRDTVQIRPTSTKPLPLEPLTKRWRSAGLEVGGNPFLVSVVLEGKRVVFFQDGRALIHGTNHVDQARKIYHSLIG
ncbi:ThiF family adenylyltransferase [Lederbergia galactosidilytica]|uniref:Thiamine biosynthesis protein MoeB n=1 Tax=Lederbergia galactosidilytica TaxID=217031 RepID=A0A177ZHS2_9BACI|nr:ThiF family adenylyltransferase [Lederbergia galactosidilytica]KRG15883.1 thiamine biosynthesis protein MoeB [Virgibacillus soli]MBP1915577.1 adenylyltransferase/sulfurtransferase [Lederbergia galactosidilytica]OAK67511.1 thiamine biosynthesis protein MoeB [Lederbergia galactosidilytica]